MLTQFNIHDIDICNCSHSQYVLNTHQACKNTKAMVFYYSFYGSADRLFWGFGKKIKLLLHTFLFSPTPVARPFLLRRKLSFYQQINRLTTDYSHLY